MLDKIKEILQEGDGHFVLANDANNNWIAYITLDKDAVDPDYLLKRMGTGSTAEEALDNMMRP